MAKQVKIQSCDGETFELLPEIVEMCATVKNMLKGKTAFRNSLGGQFSIDGSYVILKKEGRVLASLIKNTEEEAIISLPDVKAAILTKLIEYCQFHMNPDNTEKDKKQWDTDFVQVKQGVLCELASASYYLDIKPLVNLTSRAIATHISGKTSDEIRETFSNINYEVYAPVFASSLAIRARLQRKYNQKKTTNDGDGDLKALPSTTSQDDRSVDELLEFIGEDSSPSSTKKKKTNNNKKKKKSKQSQSQQQSPTINNNHNHNKSQSSSSSSSTTTNKNQPQTQSSKESLSSPGSLRSSIADDEYYSNLEEDDISSINGSVDSPIDVDGRSEDEFDQENDEDDDLDPEARAALDREVEEFRLRLESVNTQSRTAPKIQLQLSTGSLKSSMVGVH